MHTKYHEIRDHLWDVNRRTLEKGFRAFKMRDPRRADFTRNDILDIDFNGVELLVKLKDGRTWQGVAEDLRSSEQGVILTWAEVKAVDADLGLSSGATLGMHSKKERRIAIDLAIDAYKRAIEANEDGDAVGMASEIGYIRGLSDIAKKENAEDVARICIRQLNDLIFKFKRDFPGL